VEADEFRLEAEEEIAPETVGVRPGNTLCLVRDYNTLDHLKRTLEITHTGKTDLVVLTIRVTKGADAGYEQLAERSVFTSYEQLLFSRVVALAEKAGKKVHLLVVPSSSVFDAIAQAAAQLDSAEVIAGLSSVMTADEQARRMGEAWERLARQPPRPVSFRVIHSDGRIEEFSLGAHPPRLTDADIGLVHTLWLDLTREERLRGLHHRDVVALALRRLQRDLTAAERPRIMDDLRPPRR